MSPVAPPLLADSLPLSHQGSPRILYKALKHQWVLVSAEIPETNPPWIPRDNCKCKLAPYMHMLSISSLCRSQSCLTLCDRIDCSLPGSSVHGILQTKILE